MEHGCHSAASRPAHGGLRMKEAVRVQGLCKRYGDREVLQGVDLQVPAGTIYALLGVNGAGKTTTLECIEGLR